MRILRSRRPSLLLLLLCSLERLQTRLHRRELGCFASLFRSRALGILRRPRLALIVIGRRLLRVPAHGVRNVRHRRKDGLTALRPFREHRHLRPRLGRPFPPEVGEGGAGAARDAAGQAHAARDDAQRTACSRGVVCGPHARPWGRRVPHGCRESQTPELLLDAIVCREPRQSLLPEIAPFLQGHCVDERCFVRIVLLRELESSLRAPVDNACTFISLRSHRYCPRLLENFPNIPCCIDIHQQSHSWKGERG
mmetsp:Transcript_8943/g.29403  ORF Transcript_8943/g.29403 Transcript_8943/m.29403 type:complete len:252 (-) Transcript_8943:631-1386(-)